MPDRFPANTTTWVFTGGVWQPASATVDIVHYTNATLFINNGKLIDGRATGLSSDDINDLKARYPDDFVQLSSTLFTLPFVPVSTVVDITPQSTAAPRASRATQSSSGGQPHKKPKGGKG